MTMIELIVVGGIAALVLLVVLIGGLDAQAQRAAWDRIARRRQELDKRR
jgi:type II secretory pathway pseudopilin PulG